MHRQDTEFSPWLTGKQAAIIRVDGWDAAFKRKEYAAMFTTGKHVKYEGTVWEIFDYDVTDGTLGIVLGPADWKGEIDDECPTIIVRNLLGLRPVAVTA